MISFLVLGFVVSVVVCDPVSVCDPNIGRHFIADHVQCDRFHMCDEEGRLAAEFVCMDGLVFHPGSSQCALPFKAHCVEEGRTLLQEPKPEGNCQRQNGRWAIADTCDQYYDCVAGKERKVTCQNLLVFDLKTGNCEHPDSANRPGCTAEELYGFSCPSTVGSGRYAAKSDCRAFFSCGSFTNFHPRLSGCPQGQVFNPSSQRCDDPLNVPGCEDYYGPTDSAKRR